MLTVPTIIAGVLAIAWILSTIALVWLIRSLMKLVLDKASAEDLPKVLDSLAPLLSTLVRALARTRNPRDDAGPDRTIES